MTNRKKRMLSLMTALGVTMSCVAPWYSENTLKIKAETSTIWDGTSVGISQIFMDLNLARVVATYLGYSQDAPLDQIYVTRDELSSIKGELNSDGTYVFMGSGKGIQSLDGIQYLTGVTNLDVSSNQISILTPDMFNNLTNLLTLDLHLNKISNITTPLFSGLVSLIGLDLSNNQITEISDYSFNDLVNLQTLYLYRNPVNNVSEDSFRNVPNLRALFISDTPITYLPTTLFYNLGNLEVLWLPNNQINNLSPNMFNGLRNLQSLNFNNNRIDNLSPGIFSGLTNISNIDLSRNLISTISPNSFDGVTNLKQLSLSSNKISNITPILSLINYNPYLSQLALYNQSPELNVVKKNVKRPKYSIQELGIVGGVTPDGQPLPFVISNLINCTYSKGLFTVIDVTMPIVFNFSQTLPCNSSQATFSGTATVNFV